MLGQGSFTLTLGEPREFAGIRLELKTNKAPQKICVNGKNEIFADHGQLHWRHTDGTLLRLGVRKSGPRTCFCEVCSDHLHLFATEMAEA